MAADTALTLRFLGTGNAACVPVYGCDCRACVRATADASRRRAHACALVEHEGGRVLIDAGHWDLRERFPSGTLRRILMTHYHADHAQGLLELRWGVGRRIRVDGPEDDGFSDLHRHPGILEFAPALRAFQPLALEGMTVTPLPLTHSRPCFGYLIEAGDRSLAYLTDTVGLPDESRRFLARRGVDCVVVDCSHPPGQGKGNHNDLRQALDVHDQVCPGRTLLTHLGHEMDCWLLDPANGLPTGVEAAADGLTVRV